MRELDSTVQSTRKALFSCVRTMRSVPFSILTIVVLLLQGVIYGVNPTTTHAATPNAIQLENQRAGDATWDDFASASQQDAINGYASPISVNHGQPIDFYITTTAASYTIKVYRMGWYGGAGARLMQTVGPLTGVHQAIPAPDPVTGMVSCDGKWQKSYSLSVPSAWTTGVYLAKLVASSGKDSYIFFVVRNDGGHEAIAFQNSVTTYEAYNAWGGVSLYDNQTGGGVYKYAHATKVSFDRPFNPLDDNGAGHFLEYEYPFIRWAESQGYDLAYITDVDTHSNVNPLTNHQAFLSVGHDEYWSRGMRTNVQNAINAGVNVAFFSANTMYWQIRFEPNADGLANRVEVGYKDFATSSSAPGPDPQLGVNNSIVSTYWRDTPVNQPENGVIGVMYDGQVPNTNYAYVVQNASNWIYAGTGFTNGTSIPGVVGYEYDKVWNNGSSPPGMITLSNSPVCCGDTQWDNSKNTFAQSTLYTAPSGARVFAGGTIAWSWGLNNYSSPANYVNAGFQKTTANILANFTSGAATPAPAVSLTPSSLSFGSQAVGTRSAGQTVTLTNSGNAALSITSVGITGINTADFAQTNTCPSGSNTLAAGSSCVISVTFAPSATGSRSASVSIGDNASGSPHTVSLSGSGTAPGVSLNPGSLTFAGQPTGTTSTPQSITLTNSGTAPLSISSISITGTNSGDFGQTTTCPLSPTTLAASASCAISVSFSPSATGSRTASVSIVDNAAGSPQSVSLSGTGTAPAPVVSLSPGSLSFGNQRTGTTSSAQTFTLTNTGNAVLTINSIGLTGTNSGDFAQTTTCPGTMAAGANCTISVTFNPTATGSRTASVSIADNASGSPHTAALSGTGTAPAVTLNPGSLSFGNQVINTTSAAMSVTLTNSGTAALTISSISVTGTNSSDFAQTTTCPLSPSTLAAGATCGINVTFKPSTTSSETAGVSISDNASGSPHTVSLNGTGISQPPAVSLVGSATGSGDFSSGVTLNVPSAVAAGDLLIAVAGSNGTPGSWTTPTGWTAGTNSAAPSGQGLTWWWKVATSTDAGTSVTLKASAFADGGAELLAERGLSASSPILAVSTMATNDNGGVGNVTKPTYNSVSWSGSTGVVDLLLMSWQPNPTTVTWPGAFALQASANDGFASVAAGANLTPQTTTSLAAQTATLSTAADVVPTLQVALRVGP